MHKILDRSRAFVLLIGTLGCLAGVGCEQGTCCDPELEPGVGDNPTCFEGATCCADGQWRCNSGSGSPMCLPFGTVCNEVCGGIQGIACTSGDDYCRFPVGECCCDIQGVCVPKPEVCPEVFDPVCGCDGMSYSNSCFAAMAGATLLSESACEEP